MIIGNPLESSKKTISIFVSVFGFAFIATNTIALFFLGPQEFQRLGSFWVALLLLIFGLVRLTSSEIAKAVDGRGQFVGLAERKLKNAIYDKERGWLNFMNSDGEVYEQRLLTKEEITDFTNDFNDHLQSVVLSSELFVGAIATLQWGYGDLFHRWVQNALP